MLTAMDSDGKQSEVLQRINASRMGRWIAANLCVLPISKKKRPEFCWKKFQSQLPSAIYLAIWSAYGTKDPPFGCVTGKISGGLEVLDFDHDAEFVFPQWFEIVRHIIEPAGLPVVRTPRGGRHVWYRCNVISGAHVLARTSGNEPRIETRGEGGFIVAPPADGVHSSGKPYEQESGYWLPTVPRITPEQRAELWSSARLFNLGKTRQQELAELAVKQSKRLSYPTSSNVGDTTPWDDFNARMSASHLLTSLGWRHCGGNRWARPGKTDAGHSATVITAKDGHEAIQVFSSSTGIPPGAHSKFHFWAHFRFSGDKRAAAREARRMQFGSARKPSPGMQQIADAVLKGSK